MLIPIPKKRSNKTRFFFLLCNRRFFHRSVCLSLESSHQLRTWFMSWFTISTHHKSKWLCCSGSRCFEWLGRFGPAHLPIVNEPRSWRRSSHFHTHTHTHCRSYFSPSLRHTDVSCLQTVPVFLRELCSPMCRCRRRPPTGPSCASSWRRSSTPTGPSVPTWSTCLVASLICWKPASACSWRSAAARRLTCAQAHAHHPLTGSWLRHTFSPPSATTCLVSSGGRDLIRWFLSFLSFFVCVRHLSSAHMLFIKKWVSQRN